MTDRPDAASSHHDEVEGWESLAAELPPSFDVPAATAASVLERVLATPQPATAARAPRPRRLGRLPGRVAAAAAIAACVAGALLAVNLVDQRSAAASIEFDEQGSDIVATVTDPFAASGELSRELAARGFDIDLRLTPASPSRVGTVVEITDGGGDSGIVALADGPCLDGGSCPVGLRIPADFQGSAEITLGRPARDDEPYVATGSAFAPGEPLAGAQLAGRPVADAFRELDRRGLEAIWRTVDDGESVLLDPGDLDPGWFVVGSTSHAPDTVILWVDPEPSP